MSQIFCLFVSWVSELWIYILNLKSSASILTYICMCGSESEFCIWIRIHEAPEYGSNTDPDPQHCFLLRKIEAKTGIVYTSEKGEHW